MFPGQREIFINSKPSRKVVLFNGRGKGAEVMEREKRLRDRVITIKPTSKVETLRRSKTFD
jgi:hypothetical protein